MRARSRAKGLGKLVDVFRTAAWVRRHDVVIVPGMGVLEATLPLRPWGFPYSLFLLCATGRLFGTRVALVSVGAAAIGERSTAGPGHAGRRGWPRTGRTGTRTSRDAMRAMGVDTARDEVYPDLAFALPTPLASRRPRARGARSASASWPSTAATTTAPGPRRSTGATSTGSTRFVRALVEDGRPVRLLTGDEVDAVGGRRDPRRGGLAAGHRCRGVLGWPILMKEMAAADTVVATRYHNLICALKVGTPTLALSYAAKSDALMAQMGLAAYCHPAREVDADRLLEQFRALEQHRRGCGRGPSASGTPVRRAPRATSSPP